MKHFILLSVILCAGCSVRTPDRVDEENMKWYVQNNVEPDSETIIAIYCKYGEEKTNQMRIEQGW